MLYDYAILTPQIKFMSITKEYKQIYKREIEVPFCNSIISYSIIDDKYSYQPLSHNCDHDCKVTCKDNCHIGLGALMRKNLVFYCYGESEIVDKYNSGFFNGLEEDSLYAYKNRLPKRTPEQDGLPGEVLLDLLIQTLQPNAYKLAIRAILRQDDNFEIKGYDLTYFTIEDNKITLWLGQSKLGGKNYSIDGIHNDLIEKYKNEYLSKQLYFIADKQTGVTDDGKKLTNAINGINKIMINENASEREKALIQYFSDNNIEIIIPCLIAYGRGSLYADIREVKKKIVDEVNELKVKFEKEEYRFEGINPKIIFYIFPLKDINKLRGDGGFYDGLC